jgi:hypothetical protein
MFYPIEYLGTVYNLSVFLGSTDSYYLFPKFRRRSQSLSHNPYLPRKLATRTYRISLHLPQILSLGEQVGSDACTLQLEILHPGNRRHISSLHEPL